MSSKRNEVFLIKKPNTSWSRGCLNASWKMPWIFLPGADGCSPCPLGAVQPELAEPGGCCQVERGNELLSAPPSLTSTSLLPLPGQQRGVKGGAPSAAVFSFSLGAWQPLLLDQNAFSFRLWDSNALNAHLRGERWYIQAHHSQLKGIHRSL